MWPMSLCGRWSTGCKDLRVVWGHHQLMGESSIILFGIWAGG